ncbi:MAG: hypothetical protein LKG38_06930 [Atopobiaceae bacterium]|jgi:hypothetical protein|nr:hypothetical protein [Atopobiaceae bacterium]MCI1389686.1 hypothetical protein [Atopobiaceae bacterium]
MVMDAVAFAVALVDSDGFARLSGLPTSYVYSLAFDGGSLSIAGRIELETDIAKALTSNGTQVTALLDRDQNQGISFFGTNAQGDSAMCMAFLYIMIVVMAFIFVILTNATVEKESSVIGTLLASGCARGRPCATTSSCLPSWESWPAWRAASWATRFSRGWPGPLLPLLQPAALPGELRRKDVRPHLGPALCDARRDRLRGHRPQAQGHPPPRSCAMRCPEAGAAATCASPPSWDT